MSESTALKKLLRLRVGLVLARFARFKVHHGVAEGAKRFVRLVISGLALKRSGIWSDARELGIEVGLSAKAETTPQNAEARRHLPVKSSRINRFVLAA